MTPTIRLTTAAIRFTNCRFYKACKIKRRKLPACSSGCKILLPKAIVSRGLLANPSWRQIVPCRWHSAILEVGAQFFCKLSAGKKKIKGMRRSFNVATRNVACGLRGLVMKAPKLWFFWFLTLLFLPGLALCKTYPSAFLKCCGFFSVVLF